MGGFPHIFWVAWVVFNQEWNGENMNRKIIANIIVPPWLWLGWLWMGLLWCVGLVVVISSTYEYAEETILSALDDEALVISENLKGALHDYHEIAVSVAGLSTVIDVLSGKEQQTPNLNRFLHKMNESLGSQFLYIINPSGQVVGASNALAENSFVGTSLAFRPYFQQSMLGEPGRYYARGVTTGTRGVFFSAPVVHNDKTLGVAVVKLSLEPTFEQLQQQRGDFLVVGYDGVIFGSSKLAWEQKTLYPLQEGQQDAVRKSKRYGLAGLSAVGNNSSVSVFDNKYISLQGSSLFDRYLMRRSLVEEVGWHVLAVSSVTHLYQKILLFCFYYTLLIAMLTLMQLYWRKRQEVQEHIKRMNRELERRVGELTRELTLSNNELQELVDHYRLTQKQLQETQDQLVQTAKLAVLGEMSAGINHELNQPLLALQTYNENSLRLMAKNKPGIVVKNLQEMQQILSTMQGIVSRLKVFSRRSPPELRVVNVNEVIDGVMGIMTPILNKSAVTINITPPDFSGHFFAEPIQVQQVLVNLLTNAAEAMAGQSDAKIELQLVNHDQQLDIRVTDNGPGIAENIRNKVFEPFYTTKSTGLGIGLALSKRIIETLSGTLILEDGQNDGSTFILSLPTCALVEGKSE